MWDNILLGSALIIFTILIHASATKFIMYFSSKREILKHRIFRFKDFWLSIYVLIMFSASLFEALIWALSYFQLQALTNFEEALYFSIVTFTTLGYGDITLHENWRILASLQAANGILIFGWSTAIIAAVVQKFYFKKQ